MCGICGLAARDPRATALQPAQLKAMCDAVRHRGPDDEGQLIEPGIGMGMRRLSILDLEGGHQPLANEDESVWTVFNGEIYNYRELSRQLSSTHRLRTRGDTETIVHLYEEHGPAFPERLRGMFAIAVWDRGRRRLVLARDRAGVKPLYVAETPQGLAFASEVKSLLAGGLVPAELDPRGAELFLAFGYVPGPRTLFAGVRKLPPASTLVWENGRLVDERVYWTPALRRDTRRRPWQEDQEELLDLIRRAVRGQMVSDVPLGVMLSGGIDSSLVAALMSEAAEEPIKTFSIGFSGHPDTNELDDARHVAQLLGTDHHELLTEAADHPGILRDALWHMEEPIADVSMFGFFMLSQFARASVKVALSGQGADEILGGYRKHQVAYGGELLRRLAPIRRVLGGSARILGDTSTAARGFRALAAADPGERLLAMSRVVQESERDELLQREFLVADAEPEIRSVITQHLPTERASILSETLYLDTKLALPDQLFLYFDKMSMATSLEVRVPFADHDLVSFCLSLPDERRVWLLRRKELLRRSSRGLVSERVLHKRKQGFFRPALGVWLAEHRDFVRDTLLDARARQRGQLRIESIAALIDSAGERGIKADQRLFSVLMLELWQRLFVDSASSATAAQRWPHQTP